MKKLLLLPLIVVLMVGLMIGACAKQAPAPAPTPTPAPSPTPTSAKPIAFNVASPYTPDSKTSVAANQWVKLVTERTGGMVKPTYYPGGALGAPADILGLTKSGTIGAGVFGQGFVKDFPALNFLELPFQISGPLAGQTMAYELYYMGYLDKGLEGTKVMTFEPTSHFRIFTKNKKINSLDDMKGLKIRGAGPAMAAVIQIMGAVPVTIAPADLYSSLEKGTVDGIMCGADLVTANKLYEVSKYALWEPLGTGIILFLINQNVWNSIPPVYQEVIQEVNHQISSYNLDLSLKQHIELASTLKQNKMELNSLSDTEEARWQKLINETYMPIFKQNWNAAGVPADEWLKTCLSLAQEFKYKELFE